MLNERYSIGYLMCEVLFVIGGFLLCLSIYFGLQFFQSRNEITIELVILIFCVSASFLVSSQILKAILDTAEATRSTASKTAAILNLLETPKSEIDD